LSIKQGTHVPASLVLGKLAGGMGMDEVMYEYYLNPSQVRAALGYAAQRMDEEAIYVTR
jgi:uncharacterized protein (DUF433 family)